MPGKRPAYSKHSRRKEEQIPGVWIDGIHRIRRYYDSIPIRPGPFVLFQRHGDRIGGGFQNIVLLEAKKQARVLVVEKPGVRFLDVARRPGSAEGASRELSTARFSKIRRASQDSGG
jgi:hypothetical protein